MEEMQIVEAEYYNCRLSIDKDNQWLGPVITEAELSGCYIEIGVEKVYDESESVSEYSNWVIGLQSGVIAVMLLIFIYKRFRKHN